MQEHCPLACDQDGAPPDCEFRLERVLKFVNAPLPPRPYRKRATTEYTTAVVKRMQKAAKRRGTRKPEFVPRLPTFAEFTARGGLTAGRLPARQPQQPSKTKKKCQVVDCECDREFTPAGMEKHRAYRRSHPRTNRSCASMICTLLLALF